jgi:nucleotide-binding universal stress UspA family protein
MMTFLLPVDGSENSDRAVQFVIALYHGLAPIGICLLHVEPPAPLTGGKIDVRIDDPEAVIHAGNTALQSARALLDRAGVPYTSELRQSGGYVPGAIARYAEEMDCAAIVMGTHGMGSSGELFGSIARQVVSHAEVPVTLVK